MDLDRTDCHAWDQVRNPAGNAREVTQLIERLLGLMKTSHRENEANILVCLYEIRAKIHWHIGRIFNLWGEDGTQMNKEILRANIRNEWILTHADMSQNIGIKDEYLRFSRSPRIEIFGGQRILEDQGNIEIRYGITWISIQFRSNTGEIECSRIFTTMTDI